MVLATGATPEKHGTWAKQGGHGETGSPKETIDFCAIAGLACLRAQVRVPEVGGRRAARDRHGGADRARREEMGDGRTAVLLGPAAPPEGM